MSAADRESLWGALHAVAFDVGADSGEFVHAHAADVLWKRLNALTEPWLLVLDNVDDPSFHCPAAPPRTWRRLAAAARHPARDGTRHEP